MRTFATVVLAGVLFAACQEPPTRPADRSTSGELQVSQASGNCLSINETTGLVGWWPGDLDASDIRGGFYGTLRNGALAGVPGYSGGAFDLSTGDTDYVELPAGVAQLTEHDITIEAWINPVGSRPQIGSTLYEIFQRGWDGEGGWGADLVRHTSDHISFRIVPPPYDAHYEIASREPIDLGVWHHVVGVRRGGTIEVWVDGVVNSMSAPSGPLRGTGRSFIGMDPFRLVNTDYDGLIDEVAVWNSALPEGIIRALYEAGRPSKCKG